MIAVHSVLDVLLLTRYELLEVALPESVARVGLTAGFWINLVATLVLGVLAFTLTYQVAARRERTANK